MKITRRHSIGIIGGTGRTGAQFAKLFRDLGFTVSVTDDRTKRKNAALLRRSDIVLFALPLSGAANLMRSVLKEGTRKDQLFLDVSSLKSRETEAMLTAKGDVIGMHPLFGPSTDPQGERIILCPARASRETMGSLVALLRRMGLKTIILTASEHDKLMATVQVVPHFKSLLMADVLRLRKTDLSAVLGMCTPSYEMEFNVLGRFLDDHPDLYMPILFRNPETQKILRTMKNIIDEYLAIAASGNLVTAERRYLACKKFFKPHLKRARRHSEACIRTLLSLSR